MSTRFINIKKRCSPLNEECNEYYNNIPCRPENCMQLDKTLRKRIAKANGKLKE